MKAPAAWQAHLVRCGPIGVFHKLLRCSWERHSVFKRPRILIMARSTYTQKLSAVQGKRAGSKLGADAEAKAAVESQRQAVRDQYRLSRHTLTSSLLALDKGGLSKGWKGSKFVGLRTQPGQKCKILMYSPRLVASQAMIRSGQGRTAPCVS